MSSEQHPVECRVLTGLDVDQESIARLRKWADNPKNDTNPIALAVRSLFKDRDRLGSLLADANKRAAEDRDEVKSLRGHLKAYQNRKA